MKCINFNFKSYELSKFSTLSRYWNQNIVYLMNTESLLLLLLCTVKCQEYSKMLMLHV